MLTVTHLKGLSSSVSNYLQKGLQSTDGIAEYYGSNSEDNFWIGGLADEFGLTGRPVDDQIFQDLLNAQLPDGSRPEQMHESARRLGEDFTFSAPKSVSIAALALDKHELLEDHNFAVMQALEFVQQKIVYARRGKGGLEREDAPAVAIACFRHVDARPVHGVVAPDLHSHCILPNTGKRADGTIGGIKIDGGERFDLIKLADSIYKSQLAERLRARGIALRETKNGFEIKSITDDVIADWSPRKQQIDKLLAERGADRQNSSAALRQWANLMSREAKDVPPEVYTNYWKNIARQQNLYVEQGLSTGYLSPDQIAENALQHLSERQSVFRQPELLAQALSLGSAYFDKKNIEQAVGIVMQKQGIGLEHDRLVTFQHAAENAYILDFAKQSMGQESAILARTDLEPFIRTQEMIQGFSYSDDQRRAIQHLLTSPDAIQTLVGAAGSGKTTALDAIAKAAQMSNIQVVGLAPSHAAKDALGSSLGIQTGTLAGWLQNPQGADKPRLIIVDEAGMVGSQDMAGLFASLGEKDRVLLVGDPKQLSPVSAGQPFADLLLDRPDAPALGEIRRQNNDEQRKIATLYSQGKGREAADALLAFSTEVEPEDLIQGAAQAYLNSDGTKVLLASKRATVDALNQEIKQQIHADHVPDATIKTVTKIAQSKAERERMSSYKVGSHIRKNNQVMQIKSVNSETQQITMTSGEVLDKPWDSGWQSCEVDELELYAGDLLLVNDNLQVMVEGDKVNLKNGTELEVYSANHEVIQVRLPNGKIGEVQTDQALPISYGWAKTVHRSQGQTVDSVVICDDGMAGASIGYVASSRQRESLQILTSDQESLAERLSGWADHAPMTPTDESASRMQEARNAGRTAAIQQMQKRKAANSSKSYQQHASQPLPAPAAPEPVYTVLKP